MMETTDNTFSKLNVICSKLEYEIRKVAGDKYDDQLSNFKAQAIALPSPEAELALKLLEKYVDIVQKSGGSDNSDSKEKLSPISILKWIFNFSSKGEKIKTISSPFRGQCNKRFTTVIYSRNAHWQPVP